MCFKISFYSLAVFILWDGLKFINFQAGIWVVSSLCFPDMNLQKMFVYKSLYRNLFSFLLGKYHGMQVESGGGPMLDLLRNYQKLPNIFTRWWDHFVFLPAMCNSSICVHAWLKWLDFLILIGVYWYLMVVLIYISLWVMILSIFYVLICFKYFFISGVSVKYVIIFNWVIWFLVELGVIYLFWIKAFY